MKIFVPTHKGIALTMAAGVTVGRLEIITNKFLEGMESVKSHPDFNFFRVSSNSNCHVLFTNSDLELASKDDEWIGTNDGGQIIGVPKYIKFISIRSYLANQIISIQQGEYVEV